MTKDTLSYICLIIGSGTVFGGIISESYTWVIAIGALFTLWAFFTKLEVIQERLEKKDSNG